MQGPKLPAFRRRQRMRLTVVRAHRGRVERLEAFVPSWLGKRSLKIDLASSKYTMQLVLFHPQTPQDSLPSLPPR